MQNTYELHAIPIPWDVIGLWFVLAALNGFFAWRLGRKWGLWSVASLWAGPLATIALAICWGKAKRNIGSAPGGAG